MKNQAPSHRELPGPARGSESGPVCQLVPGTASNLGIDSAPGACPSQWTDDSIQDHGESIGRALVFGRVAVTGMGERICAHESGATAGLKAHAAERRLEKPSSRSAARAAGPCRRWRSVLDHDSHARRVDCTFRSDGIPVTEK